MLLCEGRTIFCPKWQGTLFSVGHEIDEKEFERFFFCYELGGGGGSGAQKAEADGHLWWL